MAEKQVILDVKIKKDVQSLEDLRRELRLARDEAESIGKKFGETSKEFVKAKEKVKGLADEINNTRKASKQLTENLEPAKITEFGVKSVQTFKSIKAEIRTATEQAILMGRKFGENSVEATVAAKKVAELKDTVGDFNQKVKALNPDKFAQFSTLTNGVVRGFQAAQGAAVLFGATGKDLEKTLVKLQGVMAFADGIQGVLDSSKAFGGFANTIKGAVVKSLTTLKGALIATGIGALSVLLGYVISNFKEIKEVVLKAIPGLETLGKWVGVLVNNFTDFVGITSKAGRELDDLITKNEKSIKKQKDWLDRNSDMYDEHTNKKFQIDLDYKEKYAKLLEDAKGNENKINQKELDEIVAQRNRKLIEADKGRSLEAQKAKEDIAAKNKTAAEIAEKTRQDKLKEMLEMDKELSDMSKKKGEQGIKDADIIIGAKKAENDAFKLNDEERTKNEIDAKAALSKVNQDYIAKTAEENRAAKEAERDFLIGNTLSLLSSLQSLNETFAGQSEEQQKKAFGRNKALAIAETLITTFQSAWKAYSSQIIPGDPTSIIRAQIAAGISTVAGLAQVAKIAKTQFKGSGGGGGGGAATGGNSPVGSFQTAATGFSTTRGANSQTAQTRTPQQPPIKVIVLQKDIKDAMTNANSIQQKAIVK